MTQEQVIELARRTAEAEGWTWLTPAEATVTKDRDGRGPRWVVTSNASARGCNVSVTIDDATGRVLSKTRAPR